MKHDLQPQRNFSPEDIIRLLGDLKALIEHFSSEYTRQSSDGRDTLLKHTEYDANPIPSQHNALMWRGNSESFSVLYEETVLRPVQIFIVGSEEELRGVFGDMIPELRIRIHERRLSDAIYLFKELSAPKVRIIAITDHLQQIMPLLFETETGPVKYGTVKSRVSLKPCIASESRREELDQIVKKVIQANKR